MEKITIWLELFAAHVQSEPVYLFVMESIPLMVIAIIGGMVVQFNSLTHVITARSTLAAILSAMSVGMVVSVATELSDIKEWEVGLKIPFQVIMSLAGGMNAKQFLNWVADKTLNMVKKTDV